MVGLDVPPVGRYSTLFIGICGDCGAIKEFTSARARDLWEKFHPHERTE
jgi:hypothetical protein